MHRVFLLASLSAIGLSAGTVVYTDFGPGQTYNGLVGWGIANSATAAAFTPSTSGTLSQIDVAVVFFSQKAPVLPLSIELETDAASVPSGTILESWSLQASSVTGSAQIFSFASLVNPVLNSGTLYWLVLTTNDTNGYVWLQNSQGVSGKAFNGGSGWVYQADFPTPVLDVIADSSVPEPSYALLTGGVCLAVWRFRTRR